MHKDEQGKYRNANTHPIEAVVFDLDGVLVQSERLSWKAWLDFLHEHGKTMGEDDFRSFIGTHDSAEVIRETFNLPLSAQEIITDHQQRVMDTLEEELIITEGIPALLEDLSGRGLPMAVASNSLRPYVPRVLEVCGFEKYFQAVVTRDDVTDGKPAPDVYLKAATSLGIDPGLCMAVEDSPVGLQAAIAAGMLSIAVPNPDLRHQNFEGAHHRYETMTSLHNSLESLLNS